MEPNAEITTAVDGVHEPSAPPADESSWRSELTDLVRAASGGLLFGVPLLYTMEVWWIGTHTDPTQMLSVLGLLSVLIFFLNKTEGFRSSRDIRHRDAAADTVEAVAVGLLLTAVVLVLLRQITVHTSVTSALGKILYESVPFCLGIGVARHLLHGDRSGSDEEDEQEDEGQEEDEWEESDARGSSDDPQADSSQGEDGSDRQRRNDTLADLGATVIGAVFISLSIAPTDEVPMIASAMTPFWLLALILASLGASYAIVFVAGFTSQERRHEQEGLFQRPISETVVSYLVALATAAILLWLFQRGVQPWTDLLSRVVVLGFPAAVGGAAGRLAA